MSVELQPSARPNLFFMVGVLGSMPLEFATDFADATGARLFTKQGLRNLVRDERAKKGLSLNVNAVQVEGRFHREAVRILSAGQSVVVDSYFNSAKNRQNVPLNAASLAAANTVALSFVTSPDVIEARIKHWMTSDEGPSFKNWQRQNPLGTIMSGLATIEAPTAEEPIGQIVELDGSLPSVELIAQITQEVSATI